MTRRTIVTLHLPLDSAYVVRMLKAVALAWPDATVKGDGSEIRVIVDDDPALTLPARRRIARARIGAERSLGE